MIRAKRFKFDRRKGQGISVWNPKDPIKNQIELDKYLQEQLNKIFGSSDATRKEVVDYTVQTGDTVDSVTKLFGLSSTKK